MCHLVKATKYRDSFIRIMLFEYPSKKNEKVSGRGPQDLVKLSIHILAGATLGSKLALSWRKTRVDMLIKVTFTIARMYPRLVV